MEDYDVEDCQNGLCSKCGFNFHNGVILKFDDLTEDELCNICYWKIGDGR